MSKAPGRPHIFSIQKIYVKKGEKIKKLHQGWPTSFFTVANVKLKRILCTNRIQNRNLQTEITISFCPLHASTLQCEGSDDICFWYTSVYVAARLRHWARRCVPGIYCAMGSVPQLWEPSSERGHDAGIFVELKKNNNKITKFQTTKFVHWILTFIN